MLGHTPAELVQLAAAGDATLPAILAAELDIAAPDPDWLATLVTLAEHVQFSGDRQRDAAKSGLLHAIRVLCQTGDDRWEPAVWSGIRTYGSMMDAPEAATLGEFLAVYGGIDARQVTLQMIQSAFRARPPGPSASLGKLPDQVYKMADSILGAGAFSAGKPAALAMNAVAASAALADVRLYQYVERIAEFRQKWFLRQLKAKLAEVSQTWPADTPAARRVANFVAALPAD